MLKKTVTNTITYTIDWIEIKQIIDSYIKRKYNVTFPNETQVRAISRTGAMVEPSEFRFKFKKQEKDDYELIKK